MWLPGRRLVALASRRGRAIRPPQVRSSSSGSSSGGGAEGAPMPVVLGTGAVVGVFAAHTGLAGSLIALPVLHNLSGLSTHVVTGTVLAATTIAAGSTAAAYAAQGVTNLPACLALASTGVFTAAAGSLFSQKVKAPALKRVTGVVLICIAPVIFMGSRSRNTESTRQANDAQSPVADPTEPRSISWYQQAYDIAWTQLPFVVAGSIAGFSQGFIGVGGGLVMTTLMTVGTDLSQHTVIATALSATTLINTSATVMHYRMGHVHVRAALLISGASAITAVGASYLALQIDEAKLRQFLAVAVFASSIGMLK